MRFDPILDRFVTPPLAIVTAILLLMGGCRKDSVPEPEQPATEMTSKDDRPDPEIPQGENLERPEGWEVRLDRPDPNAVIGAEETADIFFVNMTPGWHITAHKSAVFYHPASTAEGNYLARASIYFFDPGERQREGYGVIFGGADLDGETQTYGYLLLRNTGEFLIKKRVGSETSIVQDWTSSDAVRTVESGGESVLNDMAVKVDGDQVHFILNGENIATHPSSAVPTDGVFGLRMNHGVNVHVADLSVEEESTTS